MPRSAVIYTSPEALAAFREEARRKFSGTAIKPYTFSHSQRTDAGSQRVRITELVDGTLKPELAHLSERGDATFASPADRDVRSLTYDELMDDADRARREVTLHFTSPVIVEVGGRPEPFPVLPVIFERYIAVWNEFSNTKIDAGKEGLPHVHVADFKISCAATPFGPGSQGWIRLEMERGRTEDEIALFNGLIDFAFYCGTGMYTDEGLGQTRRMERKG